jgi:uncharacterized protein (TIGR00255 family)
MIASMTAVARSQHSAEGVTVTADIRSVNSRYLDLSVRLPGDWLGLEERVRAMVAQRLGRGRVEIRIQVQREAAPVQGVTVDVARAGACLQQLRDMQRQLGLGGEITLAMLLAMPGVLASVEPAADEGRLWGVLASCLDTGLTDLAAMRQREGQTMAADFHARLDALEENLRQVQHEAAELLPAYRRRLEARLASLLGDTPAPDSVRLAQEIAILADRCDISEELLRSFSHIDQFRRIMSDPSEPAGRKLNFLLQEMNRELNTMGSKAASSGVAHRVVAMKSELEKIREQVQNVE